MTNDMKYNYLSKRYGNECYSYNLCTNKVVKSTTAATKSPYHIGIILDFPIHSFPTNGMTYKVLSLSKEMVKIGHKCTFFVCNRNFTNDAEVRALKIDGIKVHILEEDLFYDVNYISALLIKEKVDVVQYEAAQVFLKLGVHIKARTQMPSALVLHDIESNLFTQLNFSHEDIQEADYVHYVASHLADSVITLTKLDQKKRILSHNIPREKVFITQIGVDESLSYQEPDFEQKIIGFVGNQYYEPNKRAVTFLIEEVLPVVIHSVPDAKLKIIGNTPNDLIKLYKGRGNIIFTGVIPDKEEYAKALSSLFIGTCCIDAGTGMNVKVSNYCAAKLPVVLTPIAAKGYEDITSLNITQFDKNKISEQIIHFLNNKDDARQKGLENNNLILQHLSWHEIAKSMESALKYAIHSKIGDIRDSVDIKSSKVLDQMITNSNNKLLKGHHIVDVY